MKAYKILFLAFAFILSSIIGIKAQTTVITAKDFMTRMKENPELVIVDAGKAKNYATSHVKGAIYINHLDLYQKDNPIEGLILPPEELANFFGQKGIDENSEVVIYDDGTQKYNTRIYWILKCIGAQNVKLLHQKMEEWGKVRIPLDSEPKTLAPKTFTVTLNPDIMADMELVKKAADNPSMALIDARTAAEFNGSSEDSKGHIPGAINIDYKEFLLECGCFKTREEIQVIAEKYGITPDKEVVAYCKTSVRAAPVFVAFKDILGYENVKVYDGAYNEWVVTNPVIK